MQLQSIPTPVTYDYSRSFVQWDSQHDNVPRCAVHASCRLRTRDGAVREFFLTHPCAGERMYADRDLIHKPVADFHMVCEPGKEFMQVKVFAEHPVEARMAHCVGETVPTRDGRGSRIGRVDVTMRHLGSVRELTTDRAVHDAMRNNVPILGRTQYLEEDGNTLVISEYPVTVMNARPSDGRWQVDTGPVLVPDFSVQSTLAVGHFRQAYVVFNTWDWAAFTIRRAVSTVGNGHTAMHYSEPMERPVRNQLFAALLD